MNSEGCFEKSVQYKVSITMFLSYECFQHHNTTIAELWKQNPRFWKTAAGRPPAYARKINFFNIFLKTLNFTSRQQLLPKTLGGRLFDIFTPPTKRVCFQTLLNKL